MDELDRETPVFEGSLRVNVTLSGASEEKQSLVFRILNGRKNDEHGTKQDMVYMEITSDTDLFFLLTLEVTEKSFHVLKQEQSLLVDFKSFPSKLIELVDEVKQNKGFFASLHLNASSGIGILSFIEANKFKNLTHFALQFRVGTDSTIKRYLAGRLKLSLDAHLSCRNSLGIANSRIEVLDSEIKGTKEELEKLKVESSKRINELEVLSGQDKSKALLTQKEKYVAEIHALEESKNEQLDSLRNSLGERISSLEKENRKFEREGRDLKDDNGKLRSENEKNSVKLRILEESCKLKEEELKKLRKESLNMSSRLAELMNTDAQNQVLIKSLKDQVSDKEKFGLKSDELLKKTQNSAESNERKLAAYKNSVKKLTSKLHECIREVETGNDYIERLQSEIKSLKLKIKNKNIVIKQQEKVVVQSRQELSETNNKAYVKESEMNGLRQEIESLKIQIEEKNRKINETQKVLQNNQNVIEYLNKQVNRKEFRVAGIEPLVTDTSFVGKDFNQQVGSMGQEGLDDKFESRLNNIDLKMAEISSFSLDKEKGPDEFNFNSFPDPIRFNFNS